MPLISSMYDIAKVKAYTPKDLKEDTDAVPSKELIGIEVEIENVTIDRAINQVWMTKGDNSLRNNGMEFITHPIPASYAPSALRHLLSETLSKDSCCFSPRTSVHVHLNAQDMEGASVIDFVLIYCLFEKLLYRFAGRGRMKNIYCVPLLETSLVNNLAEDCLTKDWSKYTGLNLCTLRSYGTLEFRQMHGTFDVDKLLVWINLITSIKAYVMSHSTKETRQMLHTMDDTFDFQKLLVEVFGKYSEHLRSPSLSEIRFNYMTTKLATATTRNVTKVRTGMVNTAPFFKGLN